MGENERSGRRGRRSILTGGMILICLGVLIMLAKLGLWSFDKSWPLLLIVIALGTLIQRFKDLVGWLIGCVGLASLILENMEAKIYTVVALLLPVLLVIVGIYILMKHFWREKDDFD